MNENPTTTTHEKITTLFRHGFLREQDRYDMKRVEARWRLYKTVPQKTIRSGKQQKADGLTTVSRDPK